MKLERNDIIVDVIGDNGPFSLLGKSICYKIKQQDSEYLIDCGAPVFQLLGFETMKKIKGIIGTHSHDDHKRWFTDICLFMKYADSNSNCKKLNLITTETIHEEFYSTSRAALEKSFSDASDRIIEIPYIDFVNQIFIGPKANFKFSYFNTENNIKIVIKDKIEKEVSKDKAKIFINKKANRPRMLFFDDFYKEWIEPELFYPFNDNIFYSNDKNVFVDEDSNLKIEAVKSTAWHGVPSTSVKVKTDNTEILFSSDTCFNPVLWKSLSETKYNVSEKIRTDYFKDNLVINDYINDYIERIWSNERYETAMNFYNIANIIQDVAFVNSIVHTDYPNIKYIKNCKNLILTHSPDVFVSLYPVFNSGKKYLFREYNYYEIVDNKAYINNADVYYKNNGSYFVGYKSNKGKFFVLEDNQGILKISKEKLNNTNLLFKVNLFLDINGYFFDIDSIDEANNFRVRPDKLIEYVTWNKSDSSGSVKYSVRDKFAQSFDLG